MTTKATPQQFNMLEHSIHCIHEIQYNNITYKDSQCSVRSGKIERRHNHNIVHTVSICYQLTNLKCISCSMFKYIESIVPKKVKINSSQVITDLTLCVVKCCCFSILFSRYFVPNTFKIPKILSIAHRYKCDCEWLFVSQPCVSLVIHW